MPDAMRTQWKDILLLALGYGCALSLLAQAPTFQSAWQPAGQPLLSEAKAITTDAAGNSFTVGPFVGTGHIGPGPGVLEVNGASASFNDVFVMRMDAQDRVVR
jgi:hypothetical protein